MVNIPKTAGLAQIRLVDDADEPLRRDDLIILPPKLKGYDGSGINQFVPLKGGMQFLLGYGPAWRGPGSRECFFGGTDERPFLVRVHWDLSGILEQKGENAFYESLKPERVRDYEQWTGQPALRQGDIFAHPCLEWEDLRIDSPNVKRALKLLLGVDLEMEEVKTSFPHAINSPARVFRTRHILHGFVWPPWRDRYNGQGWTREPVEPIYAIGVIEAPDHTDLVLKGVHVLTRAVGILGRPEEID